MNSPSIKSVVKSLFAGLLACMTLQCFGLAVCAANQERVSFDALVYRAPIVVHCTIETPSGLRVVECYRGSLSSNDLIAVTGTGLSDLSAQFKQTAIEQENRMGAQSHARCLYERFSSHGLVGSEAIFFLQKDVSGYAILPFLPPTAGNSVAPFMGVLLVINGRAHMPLRNAANSIPVSSLSRMVRDRRALAINLSWNDRFQAIGFVIENVSESSILLNLVGDCSLVVRPLEGGNSIVLPGTGWNLFGNFDGELASGETCSGNYVLSRIDEIKHLKGMRVEVVFQVSSPSLAEPAEKRIEFILGR